MSSDGGLGDFSLMDLFRSEVETHAEVLASALLNLEKTPSDTSRIDEMMRAAHSIKGAARVVGVDPAVNLAHVMEDGFVAAQRGEITLTPADVDVMLRGVDLLGKISEATRDANADLAGAFDAPVKLLVVELTAILHPEAKAATAPAPALAPAPPPPASSAVPRSTTLTLPEWLDAEAAEDARVRLVAAIDEGCDSLRLDLRATHDLDVTGLLLLAAIPRHLAEPGRPALRVVGVSPEIRTVLDATGLAVAYDAASRDNAGGG